MADTDTSEATKATEIARWLDSEPAPRSRAAIRKAIGRRGADVRATIAMLLADPSSGVVETGPRFRGACLVWTRDAAERAGLHVIKRPGELAAGAASDAPAPPIAAVAAAPPAAPIYSADPWIDWGNG
jgi:hypothetical protein